MTDCQVKGLVGVALIALAMYGLKTDIEYSGWVLFAGIMVLL